MGNIISGSQSYCLNPNIEFDYFDEEVLILLADQKKLISATRSVGSILEIVRSFFGCRSFSCAEFCELLAEKFQMKNSDGLKEGKQLIESWLNIGLLLCYATK